MNSKILKLFSLSFFTLFSVLQAVPFEDFFEDFYGRRLVSFLLYDCSENEWFEVNAKDTVSQREVTIGLPEDPSKGRGINKREALEQIIFMVKSFDCPINCFFSILKNSGSVQKLATLQIHARNKAELEFKAVKIRELYIHQAPGCEIVLRKMSPEELSGEPLAKLGWENLKEEFSDFSSKSPFKEISLVKISLEKNGLRHCTKTRFFVTNNPAIAEADRIIQSLENPLVCLERTDCAFNPAIPRIDGQLEAAPAAAAQEARAVRIDYVDPAVAHLLPNAPAGIALAERVRQSFADSCLKFGSREWPEIDAEFAQNLVELNRSYRPFMSDEEVSNKLAILKQLKNINQLTIEIGTMLLLAESSKTIGEIKALYKSLLLLRILYQASHDAMPNDLSTGKKPTHPKYKETLKELNVALRTLWDSPRARELKTIGEFQGPTKDRLEKVECCVCLKEQAFPTKFEWLPCCQYNNPMCHECLTVCKNEAEGFNFKKCPICRDGKAYLKLQNKIALYLQERDAAQAEEVAAPAPAGGRAPARGGRRGR